MDSPTVLQKEKVSPGATVVLFKAVHVIVIFPCLFVSFLFFITVEYVPTSISLGASWILVIVLFS